MELCFCVLDSSNKMLRIKYKNIQKYQQTKSTMMFNVGFGFQIDIDIELKLNRTRRRHFFSSNRIDTILLKIYLELIPLHFQLLYTSIRKIIFQNHFLKLLLCILVLIYISGRLEISILLYSLLIFKNILKFFIIEKEISITDFCWKIVRLLV